MTCLVRRFQQSWEVMVSRSKSRARSPLFVLAAVAVGGMWLGCATNGDPAQEDPAVSPTSTSTSKADAAPRPDFEAGFPEPDASDVDATTSDASDASTACVDNGDPGGAENVAKALPDTNDGVDTTSTVKGTLNGSVDVDFYRLKVGDGFPALLQPDLQLATSGVEMCVFVKCDTVGSSNVTCSSPSAAKKSDLLTDGCCVTAPSSVSPGWDCSGTNDSAELFIRIKQTANACLPYSFSYVF